MDLETFLTTLYVIIDDWYKEEIAGHKPKRGCKGKMSDSEVLTLMVAGQWRIGVPWRSERSLVRIIQREYRHLFPDMISRSSFNERGRYLFGTLIKLHHNVAARMINQDDLYEAVDCMPIPAYSMGQGAYGKSHWLWQATKGRGAGQWFIGDHLLAAVTRHGVITGWLLGAADINDRWLLEAFLSARAGHVQLKGPLPNPHTSKKDRARPPVGQIGPFPAVGSYSIRDYLADKGFNSQRWSQHWVNAYHAVVHTVPAHNAPEAAAWSRDDKKWLASHRQVVETAFAFLQEVFGCKRIGAHSLWGQYTRLAAKIAAYNLGCFINRSLARPWGALGTLIG